MKDLITPKDLSQQQVILSSMEALVDHFYEQGKDQQNALEKTIAAFQIFKQEMELAQIEWKKQMDALAAKQAVSERQNREIETEKNTIIKILKEENQLLRQNLETTQNKLKIAEVELKKTTSKSQNQSKIQIK